MTKREKELVRQLVRQPDRYPETEVFVPCPVLDGLLVKEERCSTCGVGRCARKKNEAR